MAKKVEAEDVSESTEVELEYRGVTFTFPRNRNEWPTRAIQAFSRQKYADATELVLGAKQWDKLNEIAPKYADFFEFLNVFGELQQKECTGG